jgi:hypothetical protein
MPVLSVLTHPDRGQLPSTHFLFLRNDCKFASASLVIAYCGIQFYYTHTLPCDWPEFRSSGDTIPIRSSGDTIPISQEFRGVPETPYPSPRSSGDQTGPF